MFFKRRRKIETREEQKPSDSSSQPSEEGPSGPAETRRPASNTTQFLTGETGRDRRNVQVLLEAIAGVSGSQDLNSLLSDIVDRSIEITGAEHGLLILRGEAGRLAVRVSRARGSRDMAEDARFSTSVAIKVLEEAQPVRATVHSESEALELGRSVYDLKLRAVMCVPLASPSEEGPPKGVLYVDSRAASRQFTQGDLALFAALAQHISIAMENARLHVDSLEKLRLQQSMEVASAIQRDLMRNIPSDVEGWDLHGWYRPAESTAGDFYDFVKVKGDRLGIVVGDVTGHGIGPAVIAASAQASMRAFLRSVGEPGQAVTLLNEDLCERVEDGRFLTLFLAMLAPDGKVQGLNAGHALPFLWRNGEERIEIIGKGGPALGMISDEEYKAHPVIEMSMGDVLIIYTDGLTEARNPLEPEVLLGEEGVQKALAEAAGAGKSAKEISLSLVEAAMRLAGDTREDDITVVVARRTL